MYTPPADRGNKPLFQISIVSHSRREERSDPKLFATVIITNVLMISSIFLASTLAFLTFYHISKIVKCSLQTIKLQRKLLVALRQSHSFLYMFHLSLQLIFLIFEYPGGIHDVVSPIYTCFPVWDAARTAEIIRSINYEESIDGSVNAESLLNFVKQVPFTVPSLNQGRRVVVIGLSTYISEPVEHRIEMHYIHSNGTEDGKGKKKKKKNANREYWTVEYRMLRGGKN
ncbi:hypothetical protein PRIPAC_81840 [Pristionchus pacificus]|uniref:Uncharacterized protein n=1 Tax=Pristionchus pacificus TaxID=54126 RepID=A0A2A6CN74_PRIPA|nr:hypothetical protein PRIPAC_81840 [Pristionchus pacificus]|eukprot:PDM79503.1 hypothetical protein PRIPAC_32082 [Pristionchus pacificus]